MKRESNRERHIEERSRKRQTEKWVKGKKANE